MVSHTPPKVLYFIDGASPTPDQERDSIQFGPGVSFRNAQHIRSDGAIEKADFVTGPAVPEGYSKAYKTAPSYADWLKQSQDDAVKEMQANADAKAKAKDAQAAGAAKTSKAAAASGTAPAAPTPPPGAPADWKPNPAQ